LDGSGGKACAPAFDSRRRAAGRSPRRGESRYCRKTAAFAYETVCCAASKRSISAKASGRVSPGLLTGARLLPGGLLAIAGVAVVVRGCS